MLLEVLCYEATDDHSDLQRGNPSPDLGLISLLLLLFEPTRL